MTRTRRIALSLAAIAALIAVLVTLQRDPSSEGATPAVALTRTALPEAAPATLAEAPNLPPPPLAADRIPVESAPPPESSEPTAVPDPVTVLWVEARWPGGAPWAEAELTVASVQGLSAPKRLSSAGTAELSTIAPGDQLLLRSPGAHADLLVREEHLAAGRVELVAQIFRPLRGQVVLRGTGAGTGPLIVLAREGRGAEGPPPWERIAAEDDGRAAGWHWTRCDAQGDFEFTHLDAGLSHWLTAAGHGCAAGHQGVSVVPLEPGFEAVVPVDPLVGIELRLIDANGAPLDLGGRIPEIRAEDGLAAVGEWPLRGGSYPASLVEVDLDAPRAESWSRLFWRTREPGQSLTGIELRIELQGVTQITLVDAHPLMRGFAIHEVRWPSGLQPTTWLDLEARGEDGELAPESALAGGELWLDPLDGDGQSFLLYVASGVGENPVRFTGLAPGRYRWSFRSLQHSLRFPPAGTPEAEGTLGPDGGRFTVIAPARGRVRLELRTAPDGAPYLGRFVAQFVRESRVSLDEEGRQQFVGVQSQIFSGPPYVLEGLAPDRYVLLGFTRPFHGGTLTLPFEVDGGEQTVEVLLAE
jgi:hypothetical protein